MRLWPFAKDLSWWSKVFPQQPYAPIPVSPGEVADAVQPVFDVLGSCKHLAKSMYVMIGPGSAVIPLTTPAVPGFMAAAILEQAVPVPADEIWFVDRVAYWHDDAVAQWVCAIQIFRDGVSWMSLSSKLAVAAATHYTSFSKNVMGPGCKFALLVNGPLVGGKVYTCQFSYTPVKVGETINPAFY